MTADELATLVTAGVEVWLELYPAETRSVKSSSLALVAGVRSDPVGLTVDLEDHGYQWSVWRPVRMVTRVRVGGRTGQIYPVG